MATIDQVTIPTTGSSTQPSAWMSGTAAPDAAGSTGSAVDGSLYFRHDPASGAQLGSGVYEKLAPLSAGGPAWRPLAVPEMINVKRFGAVGDGVADDSAAFNAAFAAVRAGTAYPAGAAPVYAPAGLYLLNSPINMTGGQLNLVGDGMDQTVLLGNTGAGKCVIDMTATALSSVRELSIYTYKAVGTMPTLANPSTFGVVWARSSLASSEMNRLERVKIMLHSNDAANNGRGTIALYNFCCEVSSVRGCYLRGDTAVTLTIVNDAQFASTYVATLAQQSSMTVFEADRDTYLIGLRKACVKILGGAAFRIDAHLNNQWFQLTSVDGGPLANAYRNAVEVVGETHDLHLTGYLEECPYALGIFNSSMRGLRYELHHAHGTGAAHIWLDTTQLTSSVIHPTPNAGGAYNPGYLIDCAPGGASQVYTSEIFAYGDQNLNSQNTWVNSELSGCRIFTDQPLADFAINFPTVRGNIISAADGVSVNGVLL